MATVTIHSQRNDEADDFEITATDACGNILGAYTSRDAIAAMGIMETMAEMYPDHTLTFGRK